MSSTQDIDAIASGLIAIDSLPSTVFFPYNLALEKLPNSCLPLLPKNMRMVHSAQWQNALVCPRWSEQYFCFDSLFSHLGIVFSKQKESCTLLYWGQPTDNNARFVWSSWISVLFDTIIKVLFYPNNVWRIVRCWSDKNSKSKKISSSSESLHAILNAMQCESLLILAVILAFGGCILQLSNRWKYHSRMMKVETTRFVENGRHSMIELQFKDCAIRVPDTHDAPTEGVIGWVHTPDDFSTCVWLGTRLARWPLRIKNLLFLFFMCSLWLASVIWFCLIHCTCLEE